MQEDVVITFVGHSTFQIDTPGGISIATDLMAGFARRARPMCDDEQGPFEPIYAEPGSGDRRRSAWLERSGARQPIEHRLVVGDAYVRNVPTDIRSWGGEMEPNGNSIFIFEVAGLCIGHLGHLHHELTDTHYGEIGRLDILMCRWMAD